jgi:hypothetical protein
MSLPPNGSREPAAPSGGSQPAILIAEMMAADHRMPLLGNVTC